MSLLAPHLTSENVDQLIGLATHKGKTEIERLLAPKSERVDVPTKIRPLSVRPRVQNVTTPVIPQLALEQVEGDTSASSATPNEEQSKPQVEEKGSESAERFLVQFTMAKSTHDKLRYAQALLSHAVPNGDVAQVVDRALDVLISQLEKRKFGAIARDEKRNYVATSKPRPFTPTRNKNMYARDRHVPASVRRAVWDRDQGQCTFVSATGVRCNSRKFLEFDHIEPVARGGQATVNGMRLRCRAHNQFEAERVFGAEFMRQKRAASIQARGEP